MAAPNETLYIQNLPDSSKTKKSTIKRALLGLLSPFGPVVSLNVTKTKKLRGQAWVVFADVAAATLALRELQGQNVLGKPIRLMYALHKSDATLRKEGVAPGHEKRKRAQMGAAGGAGASAVGGLSAGAPRPSGDEDIGDDEDGAAARPPPAKRTAREPAADSAGAVGAGADATAAAGSSAAAAGAVAVEPHRILLVGNLAPEINDLMLRALFGRFPGFQDARLVAERGVAFVEYADVPSAAVALQGLHGFQVTATHALSVTFARK